MADIIEKIIDLAKKSPVAKYWWEGRGKAPPAYIAGMAVAYVDAVAGLAAGDPYVAAMTAPVDPDGNRDILSWYADLLDAAGLPRATAADRLLAVFVIMTGLGMRESSGQHCEGRDQSSDNTSAATAEAGLFQVSYDSIGKHPLLAPLFEEHRNREDLLPIFSAGITCRADSWEDWGEGKGRDFQALMKRNPRLAILYTGILMRCNRRHWGPFNTRKAEVNPDAAALFRDAAAL